jgi:acyl carrier protein
MHAGDLIPDSVPIGRPISNTFAYILDDYLRPVGVGIPGELCAGGDGVARGYLNAPEITAEKFLPDPFRNEPGARIYRTGDMARWRDDGCIEFLGRMDNQVKILGHRIEPGEIEAVLGQFTNVRQACVVSHSDEDGSNRLVAYYVLADDKKVSPQELKKFLASKLPAYMVPSLYVSLDALPLDPNGKVDRMALQARAIILATDEAFTESKGSQVNEKIVEVWKRVLHLDRVGQDDNFFDLGGDSLLLVAVHSQLQKLLEMEIQVTDLFEFTTIRTLGQHLTGGIPGPMSLSAVQQQAQNQREAFARRRIQKKCNS